jgi:hypothetical protein
MPVLKKKNPRVVGVRSRNATTVSFADPTFRARFEKELLRWQKKVRPLKEAARSSERLSERDFAVRINARG